MPPTSSSVTFGADSLSGIRVLAVDDSKINLDVAKRILEQKGAHVGLAANGAEAVDRLRAEPKGFDVVLMDVQMPVLDGHAATRRIRAELGLTDLPIIALTAGALSSDRPKALAAGMNDFLIKPFDPDKLVQCVRLHARLARPDTAEATPEAIVAATPFTLAWPEIEGIDSGAARGRFGEDVSLFRSLLGRFVTEFSGDTFGAARIHKLKGCAGTLGAVSIHRLAGQIEEASVASDAPEIRRLNWELTMRLERLRDAVHIASDVACSEADLGDDLPQPDILPEQMVNLACRLREQTQSSVDLFHALAPQLRRRLGTLPYEHVKEQVDTLQFSAAAAALEGR
jgi:CheY-like chemotaxis protein/HPt (histidine-containing phosphotransfer) domain-containing protein